MIEPLDKTAEPKDMELKHFAGAEFCRLEEYQWIILLLV